MQMQPHHRERARTVAQHEMGHHIIARIMGFATDEVTVRIIGHDGHDGSATIQLAQSLTSLDAIKSYLERRVLVLYAGALAETLTPRQTPERGVDNDKAVEIIRGAKGAEQDHAKAREAITLIRNILHPGTQDEAVVQSELDAIELRLWMRATELVEQFEEVIVGVAGALTEQLKADNAPGTFVATLTKETLDNIPNIKELPRLEP